MNQILIMGNKKGKNNNSSTVDMKKIVIFFSVAIMMFGLFLIINGIVGINNSKQKDTTGKSDVDIYSTPTVEPTEPSAIEDEEPPIIKLLVTGETIKIVATDETEIDYIEYSWNNEDIERVNVGEENKTEIEVSINIKQGTNTLKVMAVDKAQNIQERTQDFQGKVKPTVQLFINTAGDGAIIKANCEDGISKIEYTLNGEWWQLPFNDEEHKYSKEQWASIGVILEYSSDGKITSVEYTQKLIEGKNDFYVYVYSLEGLVGDTKGTHIYTP